MKKLIALVVLSMAINHGISQGLKLLLDTPFRDGPGSTSTVLRLIELKLDTIPAFIKIAYGVKNGHLQSEWIRGYYVTYKDGQTFTFSSNLLIPYYLDEFKRKIKFPVIKAYYNP